MFTRILTDVERKRIKTYLKQDGKRDQAIRKLVNRGKTYAPQIESDLALVRELQRAYDRNKTK